MKEETKRPSVYSLYEAPIAPEKIEAMSFEAIDREAGDHGFSEDEWIVVRRMIHTTADFSLIDSVRFSPGAIESAVEALSGGAHIYADSNMIKTGISEARLKAVRPDYTKQKILCHVADPDVAGEAGKAGLPRSLFAVRKAAGRLDGAVVLIGNAPVALMELCRMITEGEASPAVVVGVPVGFVHVVGSKEELMETGSPYITITGRRGGGALAVSALHSLAAIAARGKEARA